MKPSFAAPGISSATTAAASGPCTAIRAAPSMRVSVAASPAAAAIRAKSASLVPALTTM